MDKDIIYTHKFEINSNSTKSTVAVYKDESAFYKQHNPSQNFLDHSKHNTTSSQFKESNYKQTIKSRRTSVRNLAYNNFQLSASTFITLTFSDQYIPSTIQEANDLFRKFIKRINKKYNNFKYIAIPVPSNASKTNSPRPHYHMLCNFNNQVTDTQINSLWQYGYTSKKTPITDQEFRVQLNYLIKNLDESSQSNYSKRGYLYSHGLNKTIEINNDHPQYQQYLKEINDSKQTLYYKSEYRDQYDITQVEYHRSYWSQKYPDLFNKLPPATPK